MADQARLNRTYHLLINKLLDNSFAPEYSNLNDYSDYRHMKRVMCHDSHYPLKGEPNLTHKYYFGYHMQMLRLRTMTTDICGKPKDATGIMAKELRRIPTSMCDTQERFGAAECIRDLYWLANALIGNEIKKDNVLGVTHGFLTELKKMFEKAYQHNESEEIYLKPCYVLDDTFNEVKPPVSKPVTGPVSKPVPNWTAKALSTLLSNIRLNTTY